MRRCAAAYDGDCEAERSVIVKNFLIAILRCRTYLQGKRTVVRMLGRIFTRQSYYLQIMFQLLLCFLSSSVGLPSTPSASCLSSSLSIPAGLKHSLLLNTFYLSFQVAFLSVDLQPSVFLFRCLLLFQLCLEPNTLLCHVKKIPARFLRHKAKPDA
jgi:hypothetical protein